VKASKSKSQDSGDKINPNDVEERKTSDILGKKANGGRDGLEVVGTPFITEKFEEKKISDLGKDSSTSDFNKKHIICKDVYEIHGDINYMRCANNCTNKFFPAPEIGCSPGFVPSCPNCKGLAR